MIPIPRDAVPFDGCQQCGKAPCVCIPAIEFHGGKRPNELPTSELVAAITLATELRHFEWRKRLCDEFDARRAQLQDVHTDTEDCGCLDCREPG